MSDVAKRVSNNSATAATKEVSGQEAAEPVLLSGGNPQIAKREGDAPVQAYIAAMLGWKRDVGRRLDALIERTVPSVRKVVKWNSPFYGINGGEGWFLNQDVGYFDIFENQFDEAQLAEWVKQVSQLPGERM